MSSAEDPVDVAPEGVVDEVPATGDDHPVDANTPGQAPVGRYGDLDGDGHLDARERLAVLREAAIQAEYETGRREETEAQAKRNVILRMATIVVGFIVLLGGVAMMILPGPGILGIIAGLGILSRELVWAEKMLDYAKEKARVDELKEQPKWVQAATWAVTIGAIAASLSYVFLADPKPELLPWNW